MTEHDKQGGHDFHSSPTGDARTAAPAATPREREGQVIGHYTLLQPIGEGGFGAVWMAEQREPVQRRVALKIIKLGMDTHQVVARFEQERQALAILDHPNIAKVFDAGATDTGRPYFVMELCTGEPIDSYCDRHSLSITERLELFAQVCQAVQHAHTKGIIHRDIKPSNVLVSAQDGKPSAKVIDFGIAKATNARLTEKTLFTEQKQIIGTPEYMSPEQAEGSLDIDTRTDVYALGVMLYELLTGTTPFTSKELRSAAYAEIQRIIREVEPPRPSTRLSQNTDTIASVAARRQTEPKRLSAIIRGDLDWIVMKALEKDRTRRYETANGLAMDIGRYLGGEAVLAAPPSAAYRFKKFVRRNKVMVMAGGAVAAALVIATGVSVWFGLSEAEQRADAVRLGGIADVNAAKAKAQQIVAETNAAAEVKARKRAQGINTFVIKALESSDPLGTGNKDTTIAEAMGNAVKEIDSGAFKDDLETEAELRDTIGIILRNNSKYAEAKPQLEQALAMRERLFKEDDPIVAVSLFDLADLHRIQGRYAEAESLFVRALAIREKALDKNDPAVGHALIGLGFLYYIQAKYAQAEPLYVRALAILEAALGPDHASLADSLNDLALVYVAQSRFVEAEPLYLRTLAIREKNFGPDHPDVSSVLNNLANLYRDQGQNARAEPLYARSLAIKEKALGPEHADVATGLNNLGGVYFGQGKYVEAEPLFKRALSINEKSFGPDHILVANSLNNLGGLYHAQGKYADAEPVFERGHAIRIKALPKDHPSIATGLNNLARTRQALGKTVEARQGFDEALGILRRRSPNGLPALARVLWYSANARLENKDAAAALPELEESLAMAEKFLPPAHPHLKEYRETLDKCKAALAEQGK